MQLIPGVIPRGQPLLGPTSIGDENQVLSSDGLGGTFWAEMSGGGGVTDHGALTGLADDDHLQYARLDGRAGGQSVKGGTAASENLVLSSTNHATKGVVSVLDNVVFENNVGVQGKNTSGVVRALIKINSSNATVVSSFDGGGNIELRNGATVVAAANGGGFYLAAGTTSVTSIRPVGSGANEGIYLTNLGFGFSRVGNSAWEMVIAGGVTWTRIGTGHFVAGSSVSSSDVGLIRDAAGIWRVSDASTGYGQIDSRLRNYTTAGRPSAGNTGRVIFDTTLGTPIFDNGTSWVKADGTAA